MHTTASSLPHFSLHFDPGLLPWCSHPYFHRQVERLGIPVSLRVGRILGCKVSPIFTAGQITVLLSASLCLPVIWGSRTRSEISNLGQNLLVFRCALFFNNMEGYSLFSSPSILWVYHEKKQNTFFWWKEGLTIPNLSWSPFLTKEQAPSCRIASKLTKNVSVFCLLKILVFHSDDDINEWKRVLT